MEDNYQHKGMRLKLVEELKNKGLTDEKVLLAMSKVPRHLFLPKGLINLAYKDQALPISDGQTISQPYTVAFQTQLLQVSKGQKVLEIGTGSGYQAAILMELGVKLFSIERIKTLYQSALCLLTTLGYNPNLFYGDGYEGKPTYGPFDRILITAAAPEIPETLINQLKPDGRLVVPVGDSKVQSMLLIEKDSNNEIISTKHGNFVFVPMLKEKV